MVDTTFYLKKHEKDMAFACERAEYIITQYDNNIGNACCDECEFNMTTPMILTDTSPLRVELLHKLTSQILFSSGYFSDITMRKKKNAYNTYIVTTKMVKMTEEEKAELLS